MADKKHEAHDAPLWARAKHFKPQGFYTPQLMRYATDGLIRTSNIRRPGQTRGIRLFHVGDVEALITAGIEQPLKDISR